MDHLKPRATRRSTAVIIGGAACLFISGVAQAWGDCEHERKLEESMTVTSESLAIIAGAGDLEIVGGAGADEVTVRARVCASKAEWAEEAGIAVNSDGEARIETYGPDTSGMGGWGNNYLYIDLALRVPADLGLDIRDSSGDVEISGVGAVDIKDSSGDIDISQAASVVAADSSGDIELAGIAGDVTITQDSSGDIRGRDIGGSVVVARDSSGDIRFRDVSKDFLVERDSSGDVVAQGIGGDFAVLRDGSGEIRHSDVEGSVDIPEER
ncbi:MAG: hypothetical protein V2I57_03980 [Xanthomonadales bacterium]|jgi:hypothetical protein|nr:hypothetical protein [Xanthomonadales bacterium]